MPAHEANPLPSQELAAFVCAVEAGSVHGAADALELTASAVTKRLQSLERRAGVALFERGRFGLRATAAARLLYPEAKQSLTALGRAEAVLREARGSERQVITLAASYTIGEWLLPGWVAEVRHAAPAVRAQLDVVNSPLTLAAVRAGRAEIGFVEGLDPLDELDALVVYRDELVCVVARGHRWARRRRLAPADLLGEPFLAREAGSGTRGVADAALAPAGVTLEPAFEAASSQSLKRALMSGGFSLLSRLVVAGEVRSGALHEIALDGIDLTRDLHAVRRSGRELPGDAARLWHWLAAR